MESTTNKLLQLNEIAKQIEEFDNENDAIVQLILNKGSLKPVICGNYKAVQAVIEAVYRLFPDIKDIIDDVSNGESVLEELKTNHLSE